MCCNIIARAVRLYNHSSKNGETPVQQKITTKLLRIFSPVNEGVQDLRHTSAGGKGGSLVSAVFENSTSFDIAFHGSSDMVAVNAKGELASDDLRAVYIPSKKSFLL